MKDKRLSRLVGQAISKQRKLKGLTQAAVAESLNLEVATISRLETGAIAPTLKRLDQLSKLFDCPVTSFFKNHEELASLSDQGQDSAYHFDFLNSLSAEERQLVIKFVEDAVKLLEKRK